MFSTSNHQSLFFFDDVVKFQYLQKRSRKLIEELPQYLQEIRLNKAESNSKLENYFRKQRGVFKDSSVDILKKRESNSKDAIQSESSALLSVGNNNKKLNRKSSKSFYKSSSNKLSKEFNEYEDDNRFLFEEAKYSATNVLLQLGKLLEKIQELLDNSQSTNGLDENSEVILKEKEKGIYWQVNTIKEIQQQDKFELNLPDIIIELLNERYDDLIKDANVIYREWQSQIYQDIIAFTKNSSVKNIDSGIFSVPQTAMSGLYINPDGRKERKKSRSQRSNPSVSGFSSLQPKSSKDSGLTSGRTSENDGPQILCYRKETKLPRHNVPKPKTRYEKYCKNELKYQAREDSTQKINISRTEAIMEKEEKLLDEIPYPPLNHHLISFAISSRACHEKGWVIQPSSLDDPEKHTLLAWARARLQQAIKQKKKEEESSCHLLKPSDIKIIYYGNNSKISKTKKKIVIESKNDEIEKHIFKATLTDGSFTVFYPSGKPAIVTLQSSLPTSNDFYTLIYEDSPGCELLGYFTPTGRGVSHLPNGKIGFLSTSKFGSCQDENGALLKKWKWTWDKLVPPLSIQLNKNIVLRCINKHSMFLSVNINGESMKMKIGCSSDSKEPNLDEMGYLQTKFNFVSSIAVQLTKVVPKKKEDKRKWKKEKVKSSTSSDGGFTEEQMDQRLKDLEINFPNELKGIELSTPYQNELRQLQRKFKSTITNWLEHYRVATGITSPLKMKQSCRYKAKSAVFSQKKSFDGLSKNKTRVPSAPPVFRKELQSNHSIHSLQSRPLSCFQSSPAVGCCQTDQSNNSFESKQLRNLSVVKFVGPPSRIPFKCGAIKQTSIKPSTLPNDGCPIALRMKMLGADLDPICKCDKRKVPVLSDIEFDAFLQHLPKTQLLVVSIVSTSLSLVNGGDSILEKLYWQLNRNRTFPCTQSHKDPYRLTRYIVPDDKSDGVESQPLIVQRHNVVPGMFLMYEDSKLLFADYIFDGYGNSKKDFLKQISRTRKEALKGHCLPSDFQFSPSNCKGGARTPWGGQLGGLCQQTASKITSSNCSLKLFVGVDEINVTDGLRGRTPTPDSQTSTMDFISPRQSSVVRQQSSFKESVKSVSNLSPPTSQRRKSSVKSSTTTH